MPAAPSPAAPADQPSASLSGSRRPWLAPALCLGALALHLLLVLHFAPPSVVLSDQPIGNIDYSLHFYQVDRGLRAFTGWGKLWSYDPRSLAGQPAGAVEDISSKTVILFTIALHRLGVPPGKAFNLYILLVMLLPPFLGFAAARLFGLDLLKSGTVMLLWTGLWFFDSFVHWGWFCGMISWSLVSCLAILLVALLHHTIERGGRWPWLGIAALAGLVALVHPYGALAAAIPCAALVIRELLRRRFAVVPGVVLTLVVVAAASAIWLLPALSIWHYVMDSANFLKPTLSYLFYDLFDLVKEPWDTGGGPLRTALRFSCLAAALICFWRWRRQQDRRLLPLAVLVGFGFILAYAGGHLWLTSQMQPYRMVVPAVLAAAIPAAVVLVDLLRPAAENPLSVRAKLLLLLALVLIIPRLGRTVLYYMPSGLPVAKKPIPGANPQDPPPDPMTGLYGARPYRMGLAGTPPAFLQIKDWLDKHHQGRGRVVVQDWILGEYLTWATKIPILGGHDERNVQHVDAHLFRRSPQGDLPGEALRRYLEQYAVGYVVVSHPKPALEWRKDLLKFEALVAGSRIYRTKIEPSYFAVGSGRVTHQSLNQLKLSAVQGPKVVLRFHWMETLRCKPSCRVEREMVPGDRVGFIRVENPPAAFEIYNSYNF